MVTLVVVEGAVETSEACNGDIVVAGNDKYDGRRSERDVSTFHPVNGVYSQGFWIFITEEPSKS